MASSNNLVKLQYTLEHDHDNVIKWKHFPRYWPFVWGFHRSTVNSPHKGQWRRALMFSLICVWINGWVNNGEARDLRRLCDHYDVIVMDYAHDSHRFISFRSCLQLCSITNQNSLKATRFWVKFSIAANLSTSRSALRFRTALRNAYICLVKRPWVRHKERLVLMNETDIAHGKLRFRNNCSWKF